MDLSGSVYNHIAKKRVLSTLFPVHHLATEA